MNKICWKIREFCEMLRKFEETYTRNHKKTKRLEFDFRKHKKN